MTRNTRFYTYELGERLRERRAKDLHGTLRERWTTNISSALEEKLLLPFLPPFSPRRARNITRNLKVCAKEEKHVGTLVFSSEVAFKRKLTTASGWASALTKIEKLVTSSANLKSPKSAAAFSESWLKFYLLSRVENFWDTGITRCVYIDFCFEVFRTIS